MPDPAAIHDLRYGAMRLLRLRVVLVAFLKRWGVGLATLFAVFAAGTDAPLTIATGLAGTLLLPLVDAARHGWWIVPTGAAYAIAGAVPVVVSRALWWPTSWAAAERALPLDAATLRRSDRRVAAVILAPLQGVLILGLAGVAGTRPASGLPVLVAGAWLCSGVAALELSVAWMSAVRARRGGCGGRAARPDDPRSTGASPALRPLRTLPAESAVIFVLVRGRARRSAFVLVGGLVATSASATASAWSGLPLGGSLALLALCALGITSVGSDATRRELQPLWLANRALPMPRSTCERWRNGVVLLPTLVGVVSGDITAFAGSAVRVVPLAAYVVSVVGGCVIEALLPRTSETHVRAARWLLTLAICIACASEVT